MPSVKHKTIPLVTVLRLQINPYVMGMAHIPVRLLFPILSASVILLTLAVVLLFPLPLVREIRTGRVIILPFLPLRVRQKDGCPAQRVNLHNLCALAVVPRVARETVLLPTILFATHTSMGLVTVPPMMTPVIVREQTAPKGSHTGNGMKPPRPTIFPVGKEIVVNRPIWPVANVPRV